MIGLRLISVAVLFGVAGICHAQSTEKVQDTGVDAHPPSIATCVACHGAMGAGTVSGGPRLAGMNPDYLAHALAMFKAGTRASGVMQTVARDLSDSDIDNLAMFFSEQNPPLAAGAAPPSQSLVIAGKQLAEMGAGHDLAEILELRQCRDRDGFAAGLPVGRPENIKRIPACCLSTLTTL